MTAHQAALRQAADLDVSELPVLVRADLNVPMDGNFVSVMTWYDNEWGFSNRMADTAVAMGKLI